IPHLSALLAGLDLPPPPESQDWTRGMPADLGIMLNDKLNCCSIAAFYHALQVWSFNAADGVMETEPDSNVEALYCAVSGYKPAEAPPGPICNEQQVLTHIHKTGAPTGKGPNKLMAFLEVDIRNLDDIKRTIAACGVAYVGIKVPTYLKDVDWPPVLDVQAENAEPFGAHAVVLAGYDAQGARMISFGKLYTMTWAFFAKYADEAYALADQSWMEAKGTTPGGLTIEGLKKQMHAISGS
ncbi:MAG TPA: hypothetical protein VKP60_17865, partial [Magnetospirillaceae bacterium]|nr:hypothetical protein [Magnetospirillaceae bacterium]